MILHHPLNGTGKIDDFGTCGAAEIDDNKGLVFMGSHVAFSLSFPVRLLN